MADIELVIKISQGLKKDFELEQWTALSCMEMKNVLEKATLLPKGHGNLKDVDGIFNEGFPKADINVEYEENKEKYPYWRTDITGFQSILKNAPTIIKADTESEDDE